MAKPKIIFVTTDSEFGKSAQLGLKGEFDITCLDNAEEGLALLAKDPRIVAVVSGLKLPGMDGQEFLTAARRKYPKVARIMVTRNCDFPTAAEIVNTAQVLKLLSKPCPPDVLRSALGEAVKTYKQARAESEAMKDTLLGCVKMLVDVLELTNPVAARRSKRIIRRARRLSTEFKAVSVQMMDMAVLLANVGCVGLPAGVLEKMEKGVEMTPQEKKTFRTHPSIAAHLLKKVPGMGKLAHIVRFQNVPCSKNPPLASRILKVCIDMDRMQNSGANPDKAVAFMQSKPEIYDKSVVEALIRHLQECDKVKCIPVAVADLEPGMVMQTDMVTEKGVVLLNQGETLSEASHLRLQAFADLLKIKEPVCAFSSKEQLKVC